MKYDQNIIMEVSGINRAKTVRDCEFYQLGTKIEGLKQFYNMNQLTFGPFTPNINIIQLLLVKS